VAKRPEQDKDCLLFVNPNNPEGRERRNLTVKLSYDEGRTWPVAKAIEPGTSGYADLATGPDGTIYCYYERGTAGGGAANPRSLCLARFDLEWLTDGRDSLGSEDPARRGGPR
jgi:sialidase-1